MKKKILIIGAHGYIGCMVHEALLERGYDVKGVDQLLLPVDKKGGILHSRYQDLHDDVLHSVNDVICLAGHSSVKLAHDDFDGAFANNLTDMIRLLRRLKKQRLIYASSSSIYSGYGNNPASETSPCNMPVNSYDFTKLAFEQYINSHDGQAISLRFGTVNGYSHRMRPELVINSMTSAALLYGAIELTNPWAFRPVLGMSDCVAAIIKIIESNETRGAYNMASFNSSFGQIAEVVAQRFSARINHHPDCKTYNFSIDSSKFEKTFSFTFKDTVDSIIHNLVTNGYPKKAEGELLP